MQKQWLIDGNNLMHKIPEISARLSSNSDEARFLLAERVNRLCKEKGRRAKIIFDGSKGVQSMPFNKLSITYSREKTADDIIIKQIMKNGSNRRWILVTDDREIIVQAKKYGVTTTPVSSFKKLLSDKRKGKSKRNDQKPLEKRSNFIVSDAEVNEMLLLYKMKDSDEHKR